MDLFDQLEGEPHNLLPSEGEAFYFGPILDREHADTYLQELLDHTPWQNDKVVVRGELKVTKRKMTWCGDQAFTYRYSGISKVAIPWLPVVRQLKQIVERELNETFNSCLLNLYNNGDEAMSWHSDSESELKKHGIIASLSLGAERKFSFRHKITKETYSQILQHGSLLVMKGEIQQHWQHSLPPVRHVTQPRVNLTFRTVCQ